MLVLIITARTTAQTPAATPAVAVGTAFTYQGQLKHSGALVTASCDFEFTLFDTLAGGTPIGTTQANSTVAVANGLFTVMLDFGSAAWDGAARWIETTVRCPAGSGAFTTLAPRQAITPTPYALNVVGDITPRSVSVNGSLVINADGEWVGSPTGLVRPVGAQGIPGPQGAQGAQGPQGVNGQHTLVLTTAEAVGAQCPAGGTKVEHGLDANGNAVLDPGEVTASLTHYTCNGPEGPQGPQGAQGPQGPQGAAGISFYASSHDGYLPPTASLNFVTPTATAWVQSDGRIVVTSNGAFSTGGTPADGLTLYICYQNTSGGSIQSVGGGISGLRLPANSRGAVRLIGRTDGALPGSYRVGLCGRTTSPHWTDVSYGYTTAIVFNQ